MQSALSQIERWLSSTDIEPPYLLVGQDEKALETISRQAQQLAVCTATTKPCGVCAACKQAVSGAHPDITILSHEGSSIPVKAVRALLEAVHTTPLHGRRLIVIPQAERLSAPAVSALLKKLEEPAATTRFLLWSAFRRRILKTILSRCQLVHVEVGEKPVASVTMPEFGTTKETLTPDELQTVSNYLQEQAKSQGATPQLVQAFVRLKDYYKIRSVKGNEKLAGQVLLATLEQMKK